MVCPDEWNSFYQNQVQYFLILIARFDGTCLRASTNNDCKIFLITRFAPDSTPIFWIGFAKYVAGRKCCMFGEG